jgi:hypothetical protein
MTGALQEKFANHANDFVVERWCAGGALISCMEVIALFSYFS